MSDNQTTGWRPISERPWKNLAAVLLCPRRTWMDTHGNPASLDPVRDFVERAEVAFFNDGEWRESGTGHSVFHDFREDNDLPTHWMPLPEPPND